MIDDQLKSDIKSFLDMDERRLDMLLACLAQFRSADADLVDILHGHIVKMKDDDVELWELYTTVKQRFGHMTSFPHHVKAISVASIKHNQVNHPDLVMSVLRMNSHITLPVLLDVLEHPTNTGNPINAPKPA